MAVYNLAGNTLGRLAKFENETATGARGGEGQREGGLATTLRPVNDSNQEVNVVKNYPWTLSRIDDEVPFVVLKEYKCVDSSIKKQLGFYFQLVKDIGSGASGGALDVIKSFIPNKMANATIKTYENSLDVYSDIWPKDHPTGFKYKFPYFSKIGFELASEAWTSIGSMGESVKQIAQGVAGLFNSEEAQKSADKFGKRLDLMETASNTLLNAQYPSVGITDRPKMFNAHNERTININFTLYNTINGQDWQKNRDLIYLLMSQNLFNKRDLTTGVPPVFYDVYIPGQYYSYASCITNIKVDHLGNQRLLYGSYIVPDAYDVTISLTELVKPSKNQFEAIQSGAAADYVNVTPLQGPDPSTFVGVVATGFGTYTGIKVAANALGDVINQVRNNNNGQPVGNNNPKNGPVGKPQQQGATGVQVRKDANPRGGTNVIKKRPGK